MDLKTVVSDLRSELDALDSVLASLGEGDWLRLTPAEGWDIRDTVAHLADTDDLAYDHVTGGPRDLTAEAIQAGFDNFTHLQTLKGRTKTPAEVYEWWKASSTRVANALRDHDPDTRIQWGPNKITPVSFTTARLMETWAHSLDCCVAADTKPSDTDRLAHIAVMGVRAIPYALGLAKPPAVLSSPVRISLTLPSGKGFNYGPPDAPNNISGTASDFCRVFVQRARDNEAERLTASGPDVQTVLANARTYL